MDSTAAADFSLSTGGAAQPASHPQAVAAGAFSFPQQPPFAELVSDSSSQVPAVPLPLMGTHATTIVPLANTHQVVSLKLTNTNYLYWRMQMKPYLLGQGVYHFVDGSVSCPPSHTFDCRSLSAVFFFSAAVATSAANTTVFCTPCHVSSQPQLQPQQGLL